MGFLCEYCSVRHFFVLDSLLCERENNNNDLSIVLTYFEKHLIAHFEAIDADQSNF